MPHYVKHVRRSPRLSLTGKIKTKGRPGNEARGEEGEDKGRKVLWPRLLLEHSPEHLTLFLRGWNNFTSCKRPANNMLHRGFPWISITCDISPTNMDRPTDTEVYTQLYNRGPSSAINIKRANISSDTTATLHD